MPTVKLSPVFNGQTETSVGVPASGYKVYTYVAGSSTAQTTYTDSTGTVPQTNPVILNSLGYPTNGPIWLQSGLSYKLILKDASDVTVLTIDNISGINDTTVSASQWVSSGLTPTYVSASSFTMAGDQTTEFHIGRRLQFTTSGGTVYGTIKTSAYGSITTITLTTESGQLDSGLSVVNLSILRADHLAVPLPQEVSSINGGAVGGNRNYIINYDFRFDIRNEGAAQTFTASAALAYCADCWYGYCTGANLTGQRTTASGVYRYKFTGAASVTAVGFGQRMEADSTATLAGTTATLTALISSSSLTTITWTAYYANTKNTFGSLASPTRTQIASGTFTTTSSETRYNAQISIPAAATTGIEIVFTGGALLAAQTLTFGDVALLPSSVSETNIPRRLYGVEQTLTQRFGEKSFNLGTAPAQNVGLNTGELTWRAIAAGAANNASPTMSFLTSKGGNPTITLYNPNAANAQARDQSTSSDCSATSATNINPRGFFINTTANASTLVGSRLSVHFMAVWEL